MLLLVVLVACAPAPQQPVLDGSEPAPPVVKTSEKVISPPQPLEAEEPEPPVRKIQPYTELGCEGLLSAGEFAEACSQEENDLVVTYKEGTNNCFVNVKDRESARLTAGITLTSYEDAEEASGELVRRAKVLGMDIDRDVGDVVYRWPKLDREAVHFAESKYIVEVASDTRLCPKEGVESLAKMVDARLT